MKQRILIGGRYQYSPAQCLRQSSLFREYRAYDKVTKRDLLLQLHTFADDLVEKLRDIKSAFVQTVFDVIVMEEQNQTAILFQYGIQTNLHNVLKNTGYILQFDALVILKFLALGLQELHHKIIIFGRMCTENVAFYNQSLIKLANIVYPDSLPISSKSPQILRGETPTYSSDIYSLGVILYRMLYGCYPFEGTNQQQLLGKIKKQKYEKSNDQSPFTICVSKQIDVLVKQMLSYRSKDRPSIEQILFHSALSFQIETQLQNYLKPKSSILPEPFLKKYLCFRASKNIVRYNDYYDEVCYLGVNLHTEQFVSIYMPDVKMYEAEQRKIQSFFEKLRAIKDSYLPENCQFLCKLEDYERFRREPVIASEYCNQGDLLSYLDKRKHSWLSEKEICNIMYLVALAYKQMKDLGITSIHTVNSQRILIKNGNIKLRQPGIITPMIQFKLKQSTIIDYFAPELKDKTDFVELDKSDMWSYGVLFYYLLSQNIPVIDNQTSSININILNTNRKNKNIIGKCLDQNVSKRLTLDQVKLEGIDQDKLEAMLSMKKNEIKQNQDAEYDDDEEEEDNVKRKNVGKSDRIIFKSRKKRWCKNYNKIISRSSTNQCRLIFKCLIGLLLMWTVFFGIFFVEGGVGLIRSNYYRPIPLEVPYNFGTSLYNLTILSMNGKTIESEYTDYSYQQFTIDLNCTENNHTMTQKSKGFVNDYINGSHSVQCLFGFLYSIIISILYLLITVKLDLPTILTNKKQKQEDNKNIYHHVTAHLILASSMFCFFYLNVFQYIVQMEPCLGVINQNFPLFTSVETLLNGDVRLWFANVFTTIVLWSILMFVYLSLSLLSKKVNKHIYTLKIVIPVFAIMLIYTVICRIGFGTQTPLEPTWSYKMNTDFLINYWAFFGFFPQIFLLIIYAMERLVDLLFWFFLRLGMTSQEEEDIHQVEFNARISASQDYKKFQKSQTNLGNIQNQFQIFD